MADNVTTITDVDPAGYIESVEHPIRRADAKVLMELMARVTGCAPTMWGTSIIGFGRYHYRYESGREGDSMLVGFSPRKAKLVVYIVPGHEHYEAELARLGNHTTGKSCLYLTSLASIDLAVLEQIVADSVARMRREYPTFDT